MMNLFDRHMQNCSDGILFYKVFYGGWGREGVSGAAPQTAESKGQQNGYLNFKNLTAYAE